MEIIYNKKSYTDISQIIKKLGYKIYNISNCKYNKDDVNKIILCCSGGPFWDKKIESFEKITVQDALNHPIWKMGEKISIDSSTLMNKSLEIIEASVLFGVDANKIDVVIHPQHIVHSMVEFKDGSILSNLSAPDMKASISYLSLIHI